MPEQQALALDKPAAPAVPAAPAAAPEAKPQSRRFELPPDEKPAAPPAAEPKAPAAKPAEVAPKGDQNTAEQAPATAPEGEAPETPEQAEKRKSRRFERKLGSAYRREAEAKARADLLQRQLDEVRKSSATPAADPGQPKLEDFDDIEKFAAAREKFAADKALRDHQARQRFEAQKASQKNLLDSWQSRVAKADESYDDFDEVVGEIQPTTPWSHALMEAENGADIAYFLGKNLNEAKRIAALSPTAQIREIGKLEAKLLASPPTKPKTPSKAPAPTTPLEGKSPVVSDTPTESDDIGAWIRKRQRQVYGKPR